MNNTLIISTGGTFNKIYNRVTGTLDIDSHCFAVKKLEKEWLTELNCISIINKDSLDFTDNDRETLGKFIKDSNYHKIVVIHGTDTIDISAKYVDSLQLNKRIVFTGAMTPFSINPLEATANLALSIGFVQSCNIGVFLGLNGIIDRYDRVVKDRVNGKFIKKDENR